MYVFVNKLYNILVNYRLGGRSGYGEPAMVVTYGEIILQESLESTFLHTKIHNKTTVRSLTENTTSTTKY